MKLSYARGAQADLDEIWTYLAERNPRKADQTIDSITDRFLMILDNPSIGRARTDLNVHYRSLSIGEYTIFYRLHNQHIQIFHVLHNSRDLSQIVWIDDDPSQPS